MAQRFIGIYQRYSAFLAHDSDVGRYIQPALKAALIVQRDQADAMRIDTVQIGICQGLRRYGGSVTRHSPGGEDGRDLSAYGFCGNLDDHGEICSVSDEILLGGGCQTAADYGRISDRSQ